MKRDHALAAGVLSLVTALVGGLPPQARQEDRRPVTAAERPAAATP